MNRATAMLIGWCIDHHWDCDDALLAIVEAVIRVAEKRYQDVSIMLVW